MWPEIHMLFKFQVSRMKIEDFKNTFLVVDLGTMLTLWSVDLKNNWLVDFSDLKYKCSSNFKSIGWKLRISEISPKLLTFGLCWPAGLPAMMQSAAIGCIGNDDELHTIEMRDLENWKSAKTDPLNYRPIRLLYFQSSARSWNPSSQLTCNHSFSPTASSQIINSDSDLVTLPWTCCLYSPKNGGGHQYQTWDQGHSPRYIPSFW